MSQDLSGSPLDTVYMDLTFVSIQLVYVLVGAFNLFTFKVIIDMCVLIAVLLIVLDFSVRLYSSPLLFFSLVI